MRYKYEKIRRNEKEMEEEDKRVTGGPSRSV